MYIATKRKFVARQKELIFFIIISLKTVICYDEGKEEDRFVKLNIKMFELVDFLKEVKEKKKNWRLLDGWMDGWTVESY